MKSPYLLGCIAVAIASCADAIQDKAPTHIVKFKPVTANVSFAHDFIVQRHTEYQLAMRRKVVKAADAQPKAKDAIAQKDVVDKKGDKKSDDEDDDENEDEQEQEADEDEDEDEDEDKEKDKDDNKVQAASLGDSLSLEHVDLGSNGVAMMGVFPDAAFLEQLHLDPSIEYIEPNQVYKSTFVVPHHSHIKQRRGNKEPSPDWGLARINQHQRGDLETYEYDASSGTGVNVYVLDTGVYTDHQDFEGRAKHSANFVEYEKDGDMGGHGTHVAGKIAGKTYGVAKNATIHSVKILNQNGDGLTSSLIKGLTHVIEKAQSGKSIINLSLSGPKSESIDDIVEHVVKDHGIPVFVSAGNAGKDACDFAPSSNPSVFSVGASDIADNVPSYSNYGPCVRLYAPGSHIVSTYYRSDDDIKAMDGTSMSTPHVVGIAANLMSRYDFKEPQELYDMLVSSSTTDMLKFSAGHEEEGNANRLAYNTFFQ